VATKQKVSSICRRPLLITSKEGYFHTETGGEKQIQLGEKSDLSAKGFSVFIESEGVPEKTQGGGEDFLQRHFPKEGRDASDSDGKR